MWFAYADAAGDCPDKSADPCQVVFIRPQFQLHFAERHCLSGECVMTTRFWQHSLCIQSHAMQVDVSEEEDQFQAVTTACLNVLILAVETRLDVALQQMTRMPWATLETVSPAWCTSAGEPCLLQSLLPASCFANMFCRQVLPSAFAIKTHMLLISATCLCSDRIDSMYNMCAKS